MTHVDPFAPADSPLHPSNAVARKAAFLRAHRDTLEAKHLTETERETPETVVPLPVLESREMMLTHRMHLVANADGIELPPMEITDVTGQRYTLGVNPDDGTHEWVKTGGEDEEPNEEPDYFSWSYADLQAEAKRLGLKANGSADELAGRLMEYAGRTPATPDGMDLEAPPAEETLAAALAKLDNTEAS